LSGHPGSKTDAGSALEGPFFTLVFAGNLRSFKQNPHLTDTPFGRPIASGIGNAFDEIEGLIEMLDAAPSSAEQTPAKSPGCPQKPHHKDNPNDR
jgi:hypothetical protein